MTRLGTLVVTGWLAFSACDSERTTRDVETERQLDHVLTTQFETSLDAGIAREAALELSLARRLEVTDPRLEEWAGAPTVTLTPDETSLRVEVADGAQTKRLIDQLFARGAQVFSFEWKAGGLAVVLSRCDLSLTTPEAYPPWLPEPSPWPCFGDCATRSQRILAKRDLLTTFVKEHFRLRQLRAMEKCHADEAKATPDAALRGLLDRVLDLRLPEGAKLTLGDATQFKLCGGQLTQTACEALGATCEVSPHCAKECAGEPPEKASCGFRLSARK